MAVVLLCFALLLVEVGLVHLEEWYEGWRRAGVVMGQVTVYWILRMSYLRMRWPTEELLLTSLCARAGSAEWCVVVRLSG